MRREEMRTCKPPRLLRGLTPALSGARRQHINPRRNRAEVFLWSVMFFSPALPLQRVVRQPG